MVANLFFYENSGKVENCFAAILASITVTKYVTYFKARDTLVKK